LLIKENKNLAKEKDTKAFNVSRKNLLVCAHENRSELEIWATIMALIVFCENNELVSIAMKIVRIGKRGDRKEENIFMVKRERRYLTWSPQRGEEQGS
jgi:hypothetical protein